MKLLLSLIILTLLALWLWSIADSRVIQLPAPRRMVQLPKIQNNQKHNAAPAVETYLWEFTLSRYYSLTEDQTIYYTNKKADLAMNCGWTIESCKNTANWYELKKEDVGKVFSCPDSIAFDTNIKLDFRWWTMYGICKDRWGKITERRLDSRCWYGNDWVNNIRQWKGCNTWLAKVSIIK